jgi:hypothetical protein
VTKPEKGEECEACGHPTKKLTFWEGQGHAGTGAKTGDEVPWTLRSKWLCRLCSSGLAFEVHQGQVSHGLVQALNIMLETLEKRR